VCRRQMSIDPSNMLSEQITRLRKRSSLTQEQLASRLGVTYQAVSKWENGQSCPDISLLPVLSDIFGVTLDELFGKRLKRELLRNGLVAEYLFEGNARDSSGKEHHGKVKGALWGEDRFGKPNSACYLDGKDDYIVVDPAPLLSEETFSLSVWCCYDKDVRCEGWHSAIVSQDGHHGRRVFQLSTFDQSITFHRFLFEPELYAHAPLRTGVWYHIAATYEKGTFKLYRSGVKVSEQPGKLRPNADEPLYIGRKSTEEPYFFFHGKIDDLRIYDRALSEEEVRELFCENGWTPLVEPEPDEEAEREIPVLEGLHQVRMEIADRQIGAAVEWYRDCLGFKLHLEHMRQFYILTLYRGPNLLLCAVPAESAKTGMPSPFEYKTKRDITALKDQLAAAGAKVQDIEDKGFAFFLTFTDPFGCNWTVIREKR